METYKLLINGQDIDTGCYEYFPYADRTVTDLHETLRILRELRAGRIPSRLDEFVFARYCVGKEDTNQEAISAAYEAYKRFRHFPPSRRLKIMNEVHRLLLVHKEELINLMVIEGHPRRLSEWEFIGMEAVFQAETMSFYKSELVRNVGDENGELRYCVRKADGVICVSPPKNAPASNSIIGAHALLGGNTIIVKPPLHAPLSTIFLWRNIIHEAARRYGAPDGTTNIILGNSKVIMDEWLSSSSISDLLFFGDSHQGLDIGLRAFQAGKKPILELSGNDMLMVWKDADLEGAVSSLLDGFLGSTQICMVPKKGLIHEDVYEEFESRFVKRAGSLTVGLPSNPDTCLTPVAKIADFYEMLEDARRKGAILLCGGERVNHRGEPDEKGTFITPAVLRIRDIDQARSMKCVREENFFPLLPLIRVSAPVAPGESKDDVIFSKMVDLVNSNSYGLRVSAWVRSRPTIYKFVKQIQTGGLLRINARHVGFSTCLSSHGGTGRTGGPYGEMNYVWQKTTHLQGITVAGLT